MKANYDHTLLLKHMPKEFHEILNHISSLSYADKPNYQVIKFRRKNAVEINNSVIIRIAKNLTVVLR